MCAAANTGASAMAADASSADPSVAVESAAPLLPTAEQFTVAEAAECTSSAVLNEAAVADADADAGAVTSGAATNGETLSSDIRARPLRQQTGTRLRKAAHLQGVTTRSKSKGVTAAPKSGRGSQLSTPAAPPSL